MRPIRKVTQRGMSARFCVYGVVTSKANLMAGLQRRANWCVLTVVVRISAKVSDGVLLMHRSRSKWRRMLPALSLPYVLVLSAGGAWAADGSAKPQPFTFHETNIL